MSEINEMPSLEQEAFDELKDMMGEDFTELKKTFIDDTHKQMTELAQVVADKKEGDIKRISHTLCGTSGNFGLVRFSGLCKQIELSVLDGDMDKAQTEFKKLQEELKTVTEILTEE